MDRYRYQWEKALKLALKKGERELRFRALALTNKQLDELDFYVIQLHRQGYSARRVMLDEQEVMHYRIFLPAGSRMEDNNV